MIGTYQSHQVIVRRVSWGSRRPVHPSVRPSLSLSRRLSHAVNLLFFSQTHPTSDDLPHENFSTFRRALTTDLISPSSHHHLHDPSDDPSDRPNHRDHNQDYHRDLTCCQVILYSTYCLLLWWIHSSSRLWIHPELVSKSMTIVPIMIPTTCTELDHGEWPLLYMSCCC